MRIGQFGHGRGLTSEIDAEGGGDADAEEGAEEAETVVARPPAPAVVVAHDLVVRAEAVGPRDADGSTIRLQSSNVPVIDRLTASPFTLITDYRSKPIGGPIGPRPNDEESLLSCFVVFCDIYS